MATRIRLKRLGRKNRPFYRIIIIDSRKRRDGAAIEEVGWYDPILKKEKNFTLEEDRILHWLSQGAQPTDVVKNMMTKTGLSHRWHLMRLGLSDDEIEKNMQKWQLDRELTLKYRGEKALEKSALQKKEAEKEKEVEEEVKVAIESASEERDSQETESDEESIEMDDATEETDDVDSKEGSDEADVEDETESEEVTEESTESEIEDSQDEDEEASDDNSSNSKNNKNIKKTAPNDENDNTEKDNKSSD